MSSSFACLADACALFPHGNRPRSLDASFEYSIFYDAEASGETYAGVEGVEGVSRRGRMRPWVKSPVSRTCWSSSLPKGCVYSRRLGHVPVQVQDRKGERGKRRVGRVRSHLAFPRDFLSNILKTWLSLCGRGPILCHISLLLRRTRTRSLPNGTPAEVGNPRLEHDQYVQKTSPPSWLRKRGGTSKSVSYIFWGGIKCMLPPPYVV